MIDTSESRAQNWRAVVIFDDRPDALIFVGRSSTHVRQEYVDAFMELLDEEERGHASTVQMQQWSGSPDAGRWLFKSELKVPTPALVRLAA